MDIFAPNLGDLVGTDKFFKHVSARAAFMLPVGHPLTLVGGSGDRSSRPGSHVNSYAEFFTNERAINWNGYDGNPANQAFPVAEAPILLDILPTLTMLGDLVVQRTGTATHPFKRADTGASIGTAINSMLLPATAATAFPTFDLFASALHEPGVDDAVPTSWKTINLISRGSMTTLTSATYPMEGALLPLTRTKEAWALWMKPSANLAANMGMVLRLASLTAGK